jgi:hypothetical protein
MRNYKPKTPTQVEIDSARDVLRRAGFAVENLWCAEDVSYRYHCTKEQALKFANTALQNSHIMGEINFVIGEVAQAMNLKSKFNTPWL